MVFAKSLDKLSFRTQTNMDTTVFSVKNGKEFRPLRELRVQRILKLDFAKALADPFQVLSVILFAW